MKGTKTIAGKTKAITQTARTTWIPLYYSIEKDTVYTKPGNGRHYVTDLIKENTPQDIERTIEAWRRL